MRTERGAAPSCGEASAFIALGANLGDPAAQVRQALERLDALPGTSLRRASSLYRTAPLEGPDQPAYFNAVAEVRTTLSPQALLDALLAIETAFGRTRSAANQPRTLDLDLLLYGERIIDEPHLQVPHPRMHLRRFVLQPLAEIAPGIAIPGRGPLRDWLPRVANQAVERLA